MLQAYPTKRGTVVEIYDTIEDLKSLHGTMHQIADTLDENDPSQRSQR
ncbi:hypothetical protein EZS27_021632 [termite gut metagenome]|uniref:Uncharacterized protein n=1 Tax=termite gut metagenome TaxID=433724 RepID=A0A5J4R615_9ZZZZ